LSDITSIFIATFPATEKSKIDDTIESSVLFKQIRVTSSAELSDPKFSALKDTYHPDF